MRRRRPTGSPEMPIAPMIDCVFLMLVYFMTTSSLERSEADLPCPFPTAGSRADPLPAIDEQVLQLSADGELLWNGSLYALHGNRAERQRLSGQLVRFREVTVQAGSKPSIRLLVDGECPTQAVISVLDALDTAGIEAIHFA